MRWLLMIVLTACGRIDFEPIETSGPSCGPAYQPVAGLTSLYRVDSVARLTWLDAESSCEADNGHLITIEDAAENTWAGAQQMVLSVSGAEMWIGASDHTEEGAFMWVTGRAPSFTNWSTGEPNDSGADEDCAHQYPNGEWNDSTCSYTAAFICECDRVRLPAVETYCDTNDGLNCGRCGNECPPGQTCSNQQCQ